MFSAGSASEPDVSLIAGYNGQLLNLALDLGKRLLPAFDTPTGIPYGTVALPLPLAFCRCYSEFLSVVFQVNLRYGVPPQEIDVTCLAGAGCVTNGTARAVRDLTLVVHSASSLGY